ncbi:hypothetical protein ONE63_006500 [Megalurothrips usitatus]|uniref:Single-stranded DNA-binding protein, mitochondrial n=1 Tax=Megalurothrips usitatus TaxID=439358 RepID=A0AAV7XWZ7_9NEOP|nr:hypothetical protein ONE63_006500 [Megalurothrips usitatus]
MALRTVFQQAAKSCSNSLPVFSAGSARAYSNRFVNNVQLLGRVGREPQKIGTSEAVSFPFYTETILKFKDGTVKTYPCWHRVVVVRQGLSTVAVNNLEKGQRVFVQGRIAYRAPTVGEDGKMIHNHQAAVVAENLVFLEKSRKNLSVESQPQDDKQAAAAN